MKHPSFLLPAILLLLALTNLPAPSLAEDFVVGRIELEGLDKISEGTVLAFVAFDRGDTIDEEVLAATVARLFETGLFRDVGIVRDGDVVVIELSENPTIRAIRFEGMEELAEDRVTDILAGQDVAVGRIYKRGDDDFIVQAMKSLYGSQSMFLATAQVVTVPLPNNLVDLVVEINEGARVSIGAITFHGNTVFSDAELRDVFELKESGLIDTFFERDVYSESKLAGDLERIRREYLNQGYVRFDILSYDVALDSDTGALGIDVYLDEGVQYSFGAVTFSDDASDLSEEQLVAAATYAPGEVFADRLVQSYRTALLRLLRQQGHAFARVEPVVAIDDASFAVDVKYVLIPDVVAEVRRINFIGNNLTQDLVLRRQLELVEGETFDIDKLDYSLTRLRRTGFLTSVKANERRVGDDQVDVDIEVEERSQGALSVGAGYSNSDGLSFELNFARNNIFGTGNDFSMRARNEKNRNLLSASYREPNISESGITRNVSFFFSEGSASSSSSDIDDTGSIGANLTYEIPIDRNWSWTLGSEVSKNDLNQSFDDPRCPDDYNQACAFVSRYSNSIKTLQLIGGLTYDSRNSAFSPTSGTRWNIVSRLAMPPSDASYYTINSNVVSYLSLDEKERNILIFDANLRYGAATGNHVYPYFRRFYISSGELRGFKASSVGPTADNVNYGGTLVASGSVELERRVNLFGIEGARAGLFIDAAGIYAKSDNTAFVGEGVRTSAGALLKIRTPVLPLAFSYGIPLTKKNTDVFEKFQFSIGF